MSDNDKNKLVRFIIYVIALSFISYLIFLLLDLWNDSRVSDSDRGNKYIENIDENDAYESSVDGNAYEVNSAEFEARLNDDGSADITETWNVRSKKGASMDFIRKIEQPVKKAGEFDDVTDLYVTINRSLIFEMDSSSDQGYRLQKEKNDYFIHVYVYSQKRDDTIVIRYRLHNIVKNAEDKFYLFSYRFFGDHDPERLYNTQLLILSPEGSKLTKIDSKNVSGKSERVSVISNSCVRITDESKRGPLQVTIHMEGNDIFHGATPIKLKEMEKTSNRYVLETVKYFVTDRLIPGIMKYLIIILLFCLCTMIFIFKALNYNHYAFIKKKNIWGKNSNYTKAFSLTENAIDELFDIMDSKRIYMQSDYERTIRCAYTCGVENPMSILFAALLMMAGEGEAELTKDEIRISSDSLVKRKTKIDMGVRVFLNTFRPEEIPERPGWVKVPLKAITEELETDNPDTARYLRSIWRKTSRIMSSKRIHFQGKARRAARNLRKSSAYYSAAYKKISTDEMIRSVVRGNLSSRKLFEFMYLENATRSMGDLSYNPSGGEYVLYDFIYVTLCRRSAELYTHSPVKKVKFKG